MRKAFTMIEVLIAVAVIAILIAIAFVALKYASNAAKRHSTQTTLANLKAMLAELDAADKLDKTKISEWMWWRAPTPTGPPGTTGLQHVVVQGGPFDFWRTPFFENATDSPNVHPDALDAPGNVTEGGSDDRKLRRHASFAILNTNVAMARILAVPANRSNVGKISPDSTLDLWCAAAGYGEPYFASLSDRNLMIPGPTGVLGLGGETEIPPYFPTNVTAKHTNINLAVGLWRTVKATDKEPNNGAGNDWAPATSVPLLLDAWGNPIIFVPASGLRVTLSEPDPATLSNVFIVLSPEGLVSRSTVTKLPFVLNVGRPYFASAGADGDFTTGDDNLYSFEQ